MHMLCGGLQCFRCAGYSDTFAFHWMPYVSPLASSAWDGRQVVDIVVPAENPGRGGPRRAAGPYGDRLRGNRAAPEEGTLSAPGTSVAVYVELRAHLDELFEELRWLRQRVARLEEFSPWREQMEEARRAEVTDMLGAAADRPSSSENSP